MNIYDVEFSPQAELCFYTECHVCIDLCKLCYLLYVSFQRKKSHFSRSRLYTPLVVNSVKLLCYLNHTKVLHSPSIAILTELLVQMK